MQYTNHNVQHNLRLETEQTMHLNISYHETSYRTISHSDRWKFSNAYALHNTKNPQLINVDNYPLENPRTHDE